MPHIKVAEGLPGIRSLLMFRPETATPLSKLADVLLHEQNSLTPGERELIAAFVSARNDCRFCYSSHAAIAECHLNDRRLAAMVVANPETADISPKLKALIAIAAKVQQGGRMVQPADIERARREGATDVEIHDTVLIAAAFCMYNRYVDGLDAITPTDPGGYRKRARRVAEVGYSASLPERVTARDDARVNAPAGDTGSTRPPASARDLIGVRS